MKSSIENLSGLEKKLNIQVSAQEVNTEFNKVFKYLQKNVGSRGFRKGKTPMTIIRRMYNEKARGDVTQGLVDHFYPQALKEHNLTPSGSADIDCGNVEENQEFSFSACFETLPELGKIITDSLEVEKEKTDIDDQAVNQSIENILDNRATIEDVILIRELREGDFADVGFSFHKDDELLEEFCTEGHIVEIGSGSFFLSGFEEGLLGMKPGETRSLNLRFPDDYYREPLKGKEIKVEVTLNRIRKKVRPELNDELVREVSRSQTVKEFKEEVRANLIKSKERTIKEALKEKLFKTLVKANPFEIPQNLLEKQRSSLVDEFTKNMRDNNLDEEFISTYLEKQNEIFSKRAEFILKCGLLIRKIVEEKKIKVVEEDFEKYFQDFYGRTNTDVEATKLRKEEGELLRHRIIEDKVFEFLLDRAKITLAQTSHKLS